MSFEPVTIRPAEVKDIEKIWDLLHCDLKNWSEAEIGEKIHQLTVLTKQNKLLGVLYGDFIPGKKEIFWIVIHPMYPEELLKVGMLQILKGAQYQI